MLSKQAINFHPIQNVAGIKYEINYFIQLYNLVDVQIDMLYDSASSLVQ